MSSYANVTTSSMELTPMQIFFDGDDLGGSLGNVSVNFKYTMAEIKADQSGTTVRDRRVSGVEITVVTELAEVQNKDFFKLVMPFSTKVGTGTGALAAIDVKDSMGSSALALAKNLKLHPLSKDPLDASGDYVFWKALASAETVATYGPTEQTRLKVTFHVYPDESATPNKFFRYGDPAVV